MPRFNVEIMAPATFAVVAFSAEQAKRIAEVKMADTRNTLSEKAGYRVAELRLVSIEQVK